MMIPAIFWETLKTWAEVCMTPLAGDDDYKTKWRKEFVGDWTFIRLEMMKSGFLDRFLAGAEMPEKEICKAFDAWAEAERSPLPGDDEQKLKARKEFEEHWRALRLAIVKSCLLDRLVYGGETLRTKECPVHRGRWSGCNIDAQPEGCNCRHDICLTGWQQNPDDPKSVNTGLTIVMAK